MSMPKKYASPGAFRSAFRRKIPERLQKIRIMQRFAARVCEHLPKSVVKGGLALELRFEESRTTKDIDFVLSGAPDRTWDQLRGAADIDMGDFLTFTVQKEQKGGVINTAGMAYAGARYNVRAHFGPRDKPDASFSIDITYGPVDEWEVVQTKLSGFPTVRTGEIRLYPISKQIAEKVHAYTDSQVRNDPKQLRVRDLVDICFFATRRSHDGRPLLEELRHTFDSRQQAARATNSVELPSLPETLPPPPEDWAEPYLKLAQRDDLPWKNILEAFSIARAFLDPVLADSVESCRWDDHAQTWLSILDGETGPPET